MYLNEMHTIMCFSAFVLFCFLIRVNVSSGQNECIPISQCSAVTNLPRERLRDQEIIAELRKAHCGYRNEAIVRCGALEQRFRELNENAKDSPGECVAISSCPIALSLINNSSRNLQIVSLLRQAHCGYDEEAQVNCSFIESTYNNQRFSEKDDCIPIAQCPKGKKILMENTDLQKIIDALGSAYCGLDGAIMTVKCNQLNDDTTSNTKLPDPQKLECGIQGSEGKIFSGELAELDDFPWLALVYYENSPREFGCHGTLISSRHILTAAHCLDDRILQMYNMGDPKTIVLGDYDTRNETDCVEQYEGVFDCAPPAKKYDILSIKVHPEFRPADATNDIGIIKLAEEVEYTEFIRPICLAPSSYRKSENETFWVSGWGKTETAKRSFLKLKAKLEYVSKEVCNEDWRREFSDNVLCAGKGDGKDTCKGDSGGPLMYQRDIGEQAVIYELGIVSFGRGRCGTSPAIYTYVPNYLDWIKENMV